MRESEKEREKKREHCNITHNCLEKKEKQMKISIQFLCSSVIQPVYFSFVQIMCFCVLIVIKVWE